MPEIASFINQVADVHYLTVPEWGIDDSRELRRRQELQPAVAEKQFFIIQLESITVEAQNALLKIFEEPAGHSHFFLVIPAGVQLLATLKSRCQVWGAQVPAGVINSGLTQEFLAASPAERLQLVEKLDAAAFIHGLERVAVTKPSQAWSQLVLCAKYVHDTAAMPKLLLEHLALTLPSGAV